MRGISLVTDFIRITGSNIKKQSAYEKKKGNYDANVLTPLHNVVCHHGECYSDSRLEKLIHRWRLWRLLPFLNTCHGVRFVMAARLYVGVGGGVRVGLCVLLYVEQI